MKHGVPPLAAVILALTALPDRAASSDPQDSLASFAGEYSAAVEGGTFATSGSMRVVVGKLGRGSVSVKLGDEKPCVVLIGIDPGGVFRFLPGPGVDMTGNIKLVVRDGRLVIEGTVTDDGHTIPVLLSKTVAAATPGQWTFTIGATQGSADAGTGAIRVGRRGLATGVFQIGGHKPVVFASRLTESGAVPISAHLGEDTLIGDVIFPNGSVTLHEAGADRVLSIAGTPYDPKYPPLGAASGTLSFSIVGSASPAGSIHYRPPGAFFGGEFDAERLTLIVLRGWGVLAGRHGTTKVRGVVNQEAATVAGLDGGVRPFTATFTADAPSTGGAGNPAGAFPTGSGSIILSGASTLNLGSSTGNLTLTGGITGSSLGLVKSGAGTVILTGANTYTGNTTITAGTLLTGSSGIINPATFSGTLTLASGVTTSGLLTFLELLNSGSITLNLGGNFVTTPATAPVTLGTPPRVEDESAIPSAPGGN